MESSAHWDEVYAAKLPEQVSWYQPHLAQSLRLIEQAGVGLDGYVIDVGCGASTLVGDLLERGFRHVTALDVSSEALRLARARLGERAGSVEWLQGDVTQVALPAQRYDLWHDRATFHFLTDAADRQRYFEVVRRAIKPGGHVVVATFDADGPMRCSGLPTMRYGSDAVRDAFGGGFRLIDSVREAHRTPSGAEQLLRYCLLQR